MKIGFIGYGSMGSMIINGLLESQALKEENVIISNRSLEKLTKLKLKYPLIEITDDNKLVGKKADRIFIFVNTGLVKKVVEEISSHESSNMHIIHIAAGLTLPTLALIFKGKVTRVIPSVTSLGKKGISLMHHNELVKENEKKFVEDLFGVISQVKIIDEENFEVATAITSSGPAFISFIMARYAYMATLYSEISLEEAQDMVKNVLDGTSHLMCQGYHFEEIVDRVATKGGITQEGIDIMDSKLEDMFQELFKKIEAKNEEIKLRLESDYRS